MVAFTGGVTSGRVIAETSPVVALKEWPWSWGQKREYYIRRLQYGSGRF